MNKFLIGLALFAALPVMAQPKDGDTYSQATIFVSSGLYLAQVSG